MLSYGFSAGGGVAGITTSFITASSAIPLFRPRYIGLSWHYILKKPTSALLLLLYLRIYHIDISIISKN